MIKRITTLVLAVAVFVAAVFVVSAVRQYMDDRRPYTQIRRDNSSADWIGPPVGTYLNLFGLKSESGAAFDISSDIKPSILAVVDPDCRMSRHSSDLINDLEKFSRENGVRFLLVSFRKHLPDNFFQLQKEVFMTEAVYRWDEKIGEPPAMLEKMVVPSFLVLSSSGKLLQKFPGGSADRERRIKMEKQILEETTELISPK